MLKVKAVVSLLSLSVVMTGCLKPIVKNGQDTYKPKPVPHVRIDRQDNGSIYQHGMRVGLFEDTTAKYVGDVLTIVLTETTNASANSNTNSSKDNKVDLPGPTLAGNQVTDKGVEVLNNQFEGKRKFDGKGTSSMSSSFNGKISVTVAEVLPNRNLVVRGEKMMLLNQSDEYVRFIGIVRPQDIGQDNTVKSTRVANVHMAYGGKGDLSAANKMGVLGRFFQSQAWPY